MPDIIQLVPLCRVLDLSLQELLDGFEEGLGKQFISSLLIQQMDENKNINTGAMGTGTVAQNVSLLARTVLYNKKRTPHTRCP